MQSGARNPQERLAKPRNCSPMTETKIAVSALNTPLATLLASSVKPPRLVEYRGVLTPQELDAPSSEIAALTAGAAAHDLGWMRRVTLRGEDRFRWLSGMVTNTVSGLEAHTGAWNLVLNAQGRIQGDLTVWRGGDESLELEIAADQFERLIAHLDHFIIMDDVELVRHDAGSETAVGLTGPEADQVLGRMGLPTLSEPMTSVGVEWNGLDLRILRGFGVLAPHYELWAPVAGVTRLWRTLSTAGAVPVGAEALESFRIAEGIPVYGVDIAERDLPQETSQMRALSFTKGCYLGQEIVERIRSRGNVHKHLRALELKGPVPKAETDLQFDCASAGRVTSATELKLATGNRIFALGMIRGEAEVKNQPLTYTVGTATGAATILGAPPEL
jgi:folate-binding protein YgfZ